MCFGGFVLTAYLRRGRETTFNRVLSSRALTAFGKYSYALYLFNLPLRALVRDTVLTPESFPSFPGGALVGQLAFYVVSGSLVFCMAFLSYHLFEKHFLRAKRRFPPNRSADAAV